MQKRVFVVLSIVCAFVLGLALQAPPAQAQDQSYYTYVSMWGVPRDKWSAYEKELGAANAAMQKLVADGTIIAWGDGTVYVHQEDGYSYCDWFTATSRANVLKALETLRTSATGPGYVAATKHQDYLMHTIAHNGKTASISSGYLRVTEWQAKPGQSDALEGIFAKYLKSTLDAGVADGSIVMYNFDEQDIHTQAPGAHYLAILFPNGAAIDGFFAKIAAAGKDNPAPGQMIGQLTVGEAHRDLLFQVTAYQHK